VKQLSPDANNNDQEDGDPCTWVHDAGLAEMRIIRPTLRPTPTRIRITFNKAARALYNAGIPYYMLGMFRPPRRRSRRLHACRTYPSP